LSYALPSDITDCRLLELTYQCHDATGRGAAAPCDRLERAKRRKYGLVMMLTDFIATMTGRMRRRAYIEIELADF
jgi:hypothetical protein